MILIVCHIRSQMFDKHKEAQSASLGDIQQEVKSLKSLLARRTDNPSSSSSSLPISVSTPTLHQPQPTASYSPYVSPYSAAGGPGGSRFGMGSSQSYGGPGRESPSLASIANRPPGIPAWQLPQNSQAATSTTAPAATSSGNTAQPAVNGSSETSTTDGKQTDSKSDDKDMAESGEIVDPSDITA